MKLRDALLKKHTKAQMLMIVQYIGESKKRFQDLMQLFLYDEYRISQRASWAVSHCTDIHSELVEKYIPEMITKLSNPIHPAVIRNTLRILQSQDIPEHLHADIINRCTDYLLKPATPIAIKAFSLTVISNLSEIYPELKNELKAIIEDQLPTATPAFLSRVKQIKL